MSEGLLLENAAIQSVTWCKNAAMAGRECKKMLRKWWFVVSFGGEVKRNIVD